MKVNLSSILKFTVLLSLGVFLIWISVKGISADQWEEMWEAFSGLKYSWLLASAVCAMLSHLSRSHRWQMMLEPLGKKPSYANCFMILMIGYFANLAFPRLGEAARVGLIQKYENISFEKVLGTVIIDRLVDLFTLAILFVLVFIVERERLGNYAQEEIINPLMTKLGSSVATGFIALALFVALVLVAWIVLKRMGFWKKAKDFFSNVIEGFATIVKLKNFPLFIFHSFFIWIMYFTMIYLMFFATEITSGLPPMAALAALVFGAFAIIVTPGGIGAYPLVIQSILTQYGLEAHIAYGLGTLAWVVQTALILIVGFICLIALPIFNRDVSGIHKE